MDANAGSETLHGQFEALASREPARPALACDDEVLSYGALDAAANGLAQRIAAVTSPSVEPVPVLLGRGHTAVIAQLAVLKAGRAWAALDPQWPAATLRPLLARLPTEAVLVDRGTRELAEGVVAEPSHLLVVDEQGASPAGERLERAVTATAPSHVVFTSGSTGVPCGVIQTHRNMLHYVREQSQALGLSPADRLPLLFSLGSMAGCMASFRALLNGALLCPFDVAAFGAADLARWIQSQRLSMVHALPSVFRNLAAAGEADGTFASVRVVYLSGEVVTPADVELFRERFPAGCVLFNNLGSTEASSFCRQRIDHSTRVDTPLVPVGRAVMGKVVRVLGEDGRDAPPGSVGEICVSSAYLSPGYWRDDELTRRRFRETGEPDAPRALLTGDRGRLRPDGVLEHCGRADLQLSVNGHRVEAEAVEAALQRSNGVREAAVGIGAGPLAGVLIAWVAADGRTERKEWRRSLAKRLPAHMVPSRFVLVDALPRLPGGKVDRASLRSPGTRRPDLAEPPVAPRSPLEQALVPVVERVLAVEKIGVRDRFGDLGGDSLTGIELVTEVESATGRRVPLASIRKLTTIEDLAAAMEADVAGRSNAGSRYASWDDDLHRMRAAVVGSRVPLLDKPGTLIAEANRSGAGPPLFWCFNRYEGEFQQLADHLGARQRLYGLYSGARAVARTPELDRRLAEHYYEEIVELQPRGPLFLGGNCRGARVAVELAHLLLARGRAPARLCLLEYFESRLFDYPEPLLLLYGRDSSRRLFEAFGWGRAGWSEPFRRVPVVTWVPGEHGRFFSFRNVRGLARQVGSFLERGEAAPPRWWERVWHALGHAAAAPSASL